MHYTMRMIRDSLPADKKAADSYWTRWVLRPLSIPTSWLFIRLGVSANGVSYLSAFFSIGGGILFGFPGFIAPLIGALLLNLFSVLDCADGDIARVTNTAGPWGGWADAVMGYVAYVAVFLSTGVYVFLRTDMWVTLLIAALTSSADLLMRVAYQMYKNIEPERAHDSVSFERFVAENVGITGFLMPALLLCHIIGGVWVILLINALLYIGGCLLTLFKLAQKARAATLHLKK